MKLSMLTTVVKKRYRNILQNFRSFRRWNTTRQFLLFFTICSLLPLILLGCYLLFETDQKLDEKVTYILQSGEQLSQAVLQKELEELEISTSQAAFLSVSDAYAVYLKTHKTSSLLQTLKRLSQKKSLDFLCLVDQQGNTLAQTGGEHKPCSKMFSRQYQLALQGISSHTLEEWTETPRNRSDKPNIYFIAASPVFTDSTIFKNASKAVLMSGQEIQDNFDLSSLKQISTEVDVRIFHLQKEKNGLVVERQIYTSQPSLSQTLPNSVKTLFAHYLIDSGSILTSRKQWVDLHKPSIMFNENAHRIPYKSLVAPIRNANHQIIGCLVTTIPNTTELDLNRWGMLTTGFYLLIGILLVTLSGWWFNQTFVTPLGLLAEACRRIGEHQFSSPLNAPKAAPDIQRMFIRFNRMIQKLAIAEEQRNTFVAALTHDLRTPLLAERRVLESLELLQSEFPENASNMITHLLESNHDLLTMVNQMLMTYQYEAGKTPFIPSDISLPELIDRSVKKCQPLASAKSISLSVRLIPDTFGVVIGDFQQLERVMLNIIGNAIENIPRHSQITLTLCQNKHLPSFISPSGDMSERYNKLEFPAIVITDNGPGIDKKLIPNLFERYSTGYHKAQKIGSGLGLYICQLIMENHGGGIQAIRLNDNPDLSKTELNSEVSFPSHGTAFIIRFNPNAEGNKQLEDDHD
ncbi:MAG: HAMP domain-containing histidine kinase [Cyanobacteria bacterium]|nr:HAMP domain-containing histidine kinase [Cyanobacteriota bacterium]